MNVGGNVAIPIGCRLSGVTSTAGWTITIDMVTNIIRTRLSQDRIKGDEDDEQNL